MPLKITGGTIEAWVLAGLWKALDVVTSESRFVRLRGLWAGKKADWVSVETSSFGCFTTAVCRFSD